MSIKIVEVAQNQFHKKLLRDNLKLIFGEFDETILNTIEDKLEWLELESGDILISEGDVGDSLYFVLSGRLQASVKNENGVEKKIGEIVRGETVGEMAIYTGEPRFATVTALRNSVLVKLSKELFEEVLKEYPQVSLNVTKLVIDRFKKNQEKNINNHLVNVCFVSSHHTLDIINIADYVYEKLSLQNNVLKVDKDFIENEFGPIPDELTDDSGDYSKKLIHWLNNQEALHETMIYVCDDQDEYWHTKCIRQADHIFIFVDASLDPSVSTFEMEKLSKVNAKITLVLVHPKDTYTPENTRNWLDVRPWVNQNLHIRYQVDSDYNRLARIVSEKAIGIVLAGGGAKGFAHLGVIRALQEYGVVFDYVGGTSVGANIATANAFDRPIEEVISIIKKGALFNPSKDFNMLPILSIIKGKRLKTMINIALRELSGRAASLDITDTWKNLFMVATNFTKAEESALFYGDLATAIVASSSIPGIYPPVIMDGDLYVDGGTFNNFPVDVMKNIGVNKIIGIDFMIDKNRKLLIKNMPSNFEIIQDRLFFWRKKKFRVPSLTSTIVNSTILYSTSKRNNSKNMLDFHLNPNVNKYGITAWSKFDEIVESGYTYAIEVLKTMDEAELNKFRDFPKS
jgi:NTE family protein